MSWDAPGPPPTTPTDPPSHGTGPARGIEVIPGSRLRQGRFGRIFRTLPVFVPSDEATIQIELKALADRIVKPAEADKPLDAADEDQNPGIPAGYTYLGQFIDHDITFDPVSSLERQSDPDALDDFRTPRFDLDSIYGRGPADQPYLYDPADRLKLALGRSVAEGSGAAGAVDLPRLGDTAVIGDPRNDENLIVSQLQGVFLRFHNRVVDHVRAAGVDGENAFKQAQRLTRWHYQWIVVHDFLREHIVGPEVVDDILRPSTYQVSRLPDGQVSDEAAFEAVDISFIEPRLLFYEPANDAFMPVEFSVAAYRYGHSMVRPSYFINDFLREQTGQARFPIFSANTDPNNTENLNGFRPLPDQWGFQWKYFFDVSDDQALPQPSYRIDDELVNPLGSLPAEADPFKSLAFRNLLRGVRLGLPAGQTVARAMAIPELSEEEIGLSDVAPSFIGQAPLWYYILREAKLRAAGRRLGPVGGRLVAEVLIGLLASDPLSYLRVEPAWQPTLGPNPGQFGMPELLRFVEVA